MKYNNHIYFTRQERKSLFIFFIMASLFISMMFAIYRFEKQKAMPLDIALIKSTDTKDQAQKVIEKIRWRQQKRNDVKSVKAFHFDPNTISGDSIRLLGVDARTSRNFIKYRQKGVVFKSKEQFYKVYGMDKFRHHLDSLIEFKMGSTKKEETQSGRIVESSSTPKKEVADSNPIPTVKIRTLDINEADSFEWQLIKGIGEKLAGRIVRYRDRLGGFLDVDQIEEVYGIKPETFLAISHLLTVDKKQIRKIPINLCTEKDLAGHPYIGRKKAAILARYLKNKGHLNAITDLAASKLFDDEELNKIEPYLDFRLPE